METQTAVTLQYARPEHLDDVVALAQMRQLPKQTTAEVSEGGFLVSGYSREEYSSLLVKAEYFYVALDAGQVVGFIIAYGADRVGADEWLNLRLVGRLEDVVIVKQVCTHPDFARRGIATALYDQVLRRCRDQPVVAVVVAEPLNVASTQLHKRLGFIRFWEDVVPPDGHKRTVWLHEALDLGLLQAQYGHATELYQHEDNLNWSKANNFFYITAALIAALALLLQTPSGGGQPSLISLQIAFVLTWLGIGSSVAFATALRAGVAYLMQRKAAVVSIEERIVKAGGARVVSHVTSKPDARIVGRSPTQVMLRNLPYAVGLAWMVAAVLVAVRL